MAKIDLQKFFGILDKLPQLARGDPRQGCVGRTQITGSMLHNLGLKVSRIWVLPVYESVNFFAPLYDPKGLPLRVAAAEAHKGRHVRWRYHCASCLVDLPGKPVIDFPLFDGPVRLTAWQNVFRRAQRDCAAAPDVELRFVSHDFQYIPERQVLRHNSYALKQSAFLPERRLAQIASFAYVPAPEKTLPYKRHPGDGRIRRILNI